MLTPRSFVDESRDEMWRTAELHHELRGAPSSTTRSMRTAVTLESGVPVTLSRFGPVPSVWSVAGMNVSG
jgi:hypothetical protein